MIGNKKNAQSFEEIALPYLSFVYKSAYRLCGNKSDAEDLTQETFEIAFENFSQLRDDNKCKSWLFVILRNLFLKQVRKNKKQVFIDLDTLYDNKVLTKQNYQDQIKNIMDGELQEALDKLDERYKTPLVLSYIGNFSYQEISDMLKIPLGTVMSRIARGKMFLRRQLTETTGIKA